LQLTGILRETAFSPFQHAKNDRLILELTGQLLERKGHSVRLVSESNLGVTPITAPVIFSMCQGPAGTDLLGRLEQRGTLIINSPRAVQSCYRVNLFRDAGDDGVIMAPTVLVSTDPAEADGVEFGSGSAYWVKRGDVHATQAGDVVKVASREELRATLQGFHQRDIEQAALQAHIEGVVVKFYGVVGSPFFRYYAEGDFKVCPVAFAQARHAIERLVRRLGLEVYGGDAVISPSGKIHVIDINDWPSFAYFRSEAAEVIAGHIHRRSVEYAGALERAVDARGGERRGSAREVR